MKFEKGIKQLQSLAKEISGIKEEMAVKEISSSVLKRREVSLKSLWLSFKDIHDSLLLENSESEELKSLYYKVKYEYEELCSIINATLKADTEEVPKTAEKIKQQEENQHKIENPGNKKVRRFFRMVYELEAQITEVKNQVNSFTEMVLDVKKNIISKQFEDVNKLYDILIDDPENEDIEEDFLNVRRKFYEITLELASKSDEIKGSGITKTKLENIKIPIFSGNIDEWPSFHDLFKQLVDANKSISNVEKLYRLKSVVKGDAGKMIQHLHITEDNYEAAWTILKNRYENKRLLFSTIVDKLLDQPHINSQDAASIKRMLDSTTECLQALKAMGVLLVNDSPFIARILIRKLDREGLVWYEQSVHKSKEIQTLEDVMRFLEQQYLAQEAVKNKRGTSLFKNSTKQTSNFTTSQSSCRYCTVAGHNLEECRKFCDLNLISRRNWIKKEKLCEKCLRHSSFRKCYKNKNNCSKCNKSHHTLLHYTEFEKKPDEDKIQKVSNMVTRQKSSLKLLATAQVNVQSYTGEQVLLRALIDPGAMNTAITEEAAQILQLPRKKLTNKTELLGMGENPVGVAKSSVHVKLRPRFASTISHEVDALVVPHIASALPEKSFKEEVGKWREYNLADPSFYKSDRIDLLVGVDLYPEIIKSGVINHQKLLGQETTLGWIVSGMLKLHSENKKATMAITTDIEKFWELEEISEEASEGEDECEILFRNSTYLNAENRLVVKLPFKEDMELGESRKIAVARLLSLERKLAVKPDLKQEYIKFMEEYEKMSHMVRVKKQNTAKYYMPHQAVVRENHSTTKVRVVFDASTKSSNGRSLNDVLHTGPKLQNDIFDILVKWRLWRYVLTADVEKMYRQIRVADEDQSYQTILWRSDARKPIEEYRLKTVTYGTACAPFLAKRALLEIANDCKEKNKQLFAIIKDDFYMDDLMTGADTKEDCMQIQEDVKTQLSKFGFHLRKWLSNEKTILSKLNTDMNMLVKINEVESIKTLGVQWQPEADQFSFYFKLAEEPKLTKRIALSTLAKIFDPLGWLAPVTTLAKLFIQKLWLMDLDWDAALPKELYLEWYSILKNLNSIDKVKIPRWLNTTLMSNWEIHGFADASGKAYAAVVYAKVGGKISLIASKSKVNPIKNRKTLPKLELCAAHLLAKLIRKILLIIQRDVKVFAWGDSTIALAWIKSDQKVKDKFVRKRIEEIYKMVPQAEWNHVCTKDNPADAASRGMVPEKIVQHSLWWFGPTWLKEDKTMWPKQNTTKVFTAVAFKSDDTSIFHQLIAKSSNYNKIIRVVAYVQRYIKKLRGIQCSQYLTTDDINNAKTILFQKVQERLFPEEIFLLKNNKEIPTKSKICGLNPFLDDKMILRVGGRLSNADISYNRKHPILLSSCRFTDLILQWIHNSTLHGGIKLMEAVARRNFWIVGAKNCIKKQIRSCVRCIRFRKMGISQIMGDLPQSRLAMDLPFTHTGIDYAGPLQIRMSRGRGQKSYKGYIAVFICMSTKAVHLEAVSELSTEAFMAALRRFFARRGKSSHIYSDNGTNFVGAAKQIEKDYHNAIQNNSSVAEKLATENIKWHFIPPGAPHFGGIWEAAVKCVKHHLRRIIGDAKLTYEEMSTLLTQIESILNSRPLYDLSGNTDDVEVLTPGHFLIGKPLLDLPDGDNYERNVGSLNRWKLLQKMRRDFWKQWKEKYLHTLQERKKWRISHPNISKDQVVLIRDENTAPTRWPLGRVIETHAGKDGKVRVVTMKVQQGVIKRPITKICPLKSIEEEEKEVLATNPKVIKKNNDTCLSKITLVMMLCLFGNVLSSNQTTKADVMSFNDKTAIYLDNLGTIEVSTSNWNLIVYYNLKTYLDSLEQIVMTTNKSQAACSKIGEFEEQCKSTISRLKERIETVEMYNQLFSFRQNRKRKRAINFIGSFLHLLFGVMDNDDREDLEQQLRNLMDNEYNFKDMIRKQTSTVDSTINLFRKSSDEVKASFDVLQSRIDNITMMVEKQMFIYKESIKFFAVARQIEAQLEEVEKSQSQMINLLIDINHGKISPDLLKPDQLSNEVHKINEWLPANTKLPGSKGNQLETILKLMTAKAIVVDNKLVIKTNIPLISSRSASIFKIIPIPVQHQSEVVIASIPRPYLVYSFDADVYHLMTDIDFHNCRESNNQEFLCEGGWAWQDANANTCEVSPLKPHKNVHCNFIESSNENIWVKLKGAQKWLFKTYMNSTLHVYCGPKQQELVKLPRQGVVTLNEGCSAQEGKSILPSSSDINGSMEGSFGTYLINEISYNKSSSIKPLGSLLTDHAAEIDDLKKEIVKLKATDIHLKGLNFHHASGHLSLIIISIFSLIAVYYIIRKCVLTGRADMVIIRRPQNVQV